MIAGAGSGKTRVLTRRIAHILAKGDARPWEIMAITFTNKAADEMRRRVVDLVGADARDMWVSTFHSACLRMLRAHADVLGLPARLHDLRRRRRRDRGRAHHEGTQPRHQAALAAQRRRRRSRRRRTRCSRPDAYAETGDGDPHHRRIAEIYHALQRASDARQRHGLRRSLSERGARC